MFRGLFKSHDDDDKDEYFEPVDPVVEQRRKEKFSTPLIYDQDSSNKEKEIVNTGKEKKIKELKEKKEKKEEIIVDPPKSGYQPLEVISPMSGITNSKNKKSVAKKAPIKMKKRKMDDQLVPVISPFYGSFGEEEEPPIEDAVLQTVDESKEITIDEIPSVEENLRNIAKIVEEEKTQLKIIEERTGEFKLDFNDTKEEAPTLIDEIDDNMSLDELMSLYEKKFTD
ncbi:MAG: hypothetical protein ACK5LC_18380 [Coprobacillaceae bacterium]